MGAHSTNGPSSFARRRACPGSANMERPMPNKDSVFAAEGTAAHDVGERCLKNGVMPAFYENNTIHVDVNGKKKAFIVNTDMMDAVQVYVDHCNPLMGLHMIEEKLKLTFLGEGTKGTADFVALHDRILHVVDYKHGKGVPVDVKGNIQGMCYGLGAAEVYKDEDWDTLRITIVQPRAYHEDGGVRSWDIPREDMFDWMLDFATAAAATEEPDAPLNVGDHCMFCKAKPICPAQMKNAEDVMEMDFADTTSKPIPMEYLSDDQIADIVLNKIKIIEKWCSSVKDYAQSKAEAGNALKGTKLVHTRAMRVWKDKAEAEAFFAAQLGEQVFEKKFMSAPKIEKLVGKKEFGRFSDMVDKISTGVTLVPESDKRANVRPSAEDDFAIM